MEFWDSLKIAIHYILFLLFVYFSVKYERENKHLKEENKRLQDDLLHQVNENLKLKNNISTDSVE